MNTTIVYTLDCRKSSLKPDGTYPILMRIIRGNVTSQLAVKLYLHKKDWDEKERKIKSSYKGTESVARLNNYLQKKKSEAMDILTKLDEKKQLDTLSPAQIKELIQKKPERISFFKYTEKLIDELKLANRIGNARAYHFVLGVLKNYRGKKDLSFSELNYEFLMKFETEHYKKGNKTNSLAVYMRTIRAIYNRAIKDKLVDREQYPFANYQIKTKKTLKRAISASAISKIESLSFAKNHPLFHAHNYFLFCFYMRGLPFADMAHLKVSNIVDGRIKFDRQKTDKPYDVKIIENAKRILVKYLSNKKADEYIFPIIKREAVADQYKEIQWARKRYNKKLKDIAKLCGIEENLTSYVGRHSFATIAKRLEVPIANISDMLGHESIKTTQIYLDSLPNDIMDAYHEKVINFKPKRKTKKKK